MLSIQVFKCVQFQSCGFWLKPSVQNFKQTLDSILDPVTTAIRRELNAIIAKLHRIDFSKDEDPNAGMGSSLYIKELTEKTAFIQAEIVNRYNMGDSVKTWCVRFIAHWASCLTGSM